MVNFTIVLKGQMKISPSMQGAVFNDKINEFCRKYYIKGQQPPTKQDVDFLPERYNYLRASFFEETILNNTINIKITGENLPLAFLINELGVKGVEELIDTSSINFTQWSPIITYFVDSIKGVDPLAAGRRNGTIFSDPEESILSGIGFLVNQPKRKEKRTLVKKLRDNYFVVPPGMENGSVATTMSALQSGKLKALGFDLDNKDKDSLNPTEKKTLAKCAEELLGYKYLTHHHAQPSNSSYISLLMEDTFKRIQSIDNNTMFSEIAKIERFPDLKTTFMQMGYPMDEMIKLRSSRDATKFRIWLSEIKGLVSLKDVSKRYIEEITSPKGFFETFLGKSTKSLSMICVTGSIGYIVDSHLGPLVGAVASPLLNPAFDYLIDMADEYLLSEVLKGWNPKMFFEELDSVKFRYQI